MKFELEEIDEKDKWPNNLPVRDPDWLYEEGGTTVSDLSQEELAFIPTLLRNQSLWHKIAKSRLKPIDLRYEHYFDVYTKLQANPPHTKWMEIFALQYVLPAMLLMSLVVMLPNAFLSLEFFAQVTAAFGLETELARTHGIVFFYYLIFFIMTALIFIRYVKKIGFMSKFVKPEHLFYFYRYRILFLLLLIPPIFLTSPLDPLPSRGRLWFSNNVETEPTILVTKMLGLTCMSSILIITWMDFPKKLITKSYMTIIMRNVFYKSELIEEVKRHAK
ncbi:hypothetical protein KRX19_07390 [Cardiobacteriaceae bacterium TAE3-ERU3]|nr:hypothetical protein [Cardiobacteriaceae bacterium TAE3-ERU3]